VKYLFQSNYQRKIFFKYGKGVANHDGAGRWVLTRDNLDNFCIYLPPIEEQKKICLHLNEKLLISDQLRENIETKISLLELEKASITNQVVNIGLTSNNQYKVTSSKWIPKIPQHWSLKKIKHVCIIKGRIGYRGYTEDDIVDEGEGAVTLSPSNIEKDIFKLHNLTYLSWEKYEESPEIQVFMNDILLVKTGSTIGKCCIVDQYNEEMTINPQLVVLKEIKIEPKFLYYFMSSQTYKNQILSDVSGGSTPTITQESILNHYIPLPNIEEQKMIVEYLDDKLTKINTAINLEKKRISLLIEYKKTLISDAVTGKLKY
jgi:type I restriction enzyme S subunit